jgi:hypothetical protein
MPSANYAGLAVGAIYNSTTPQIVYVYPQVMRANPTINVNGLMVQSASTTTSNINTVSVAYLGTRSAEIELPISGFTAGYACWLSTGANGGSAFISGSAEL